MKKITLKQNGTFEHQWIEGVHAIPANAIDVSDAVFMQLSQHPDTKIYNPVTQVVSDYSKPFVFADAVTIKRIEINAGRDSALSSPTSTVQASGATWQSNPSAMAELNDALTLSMGLSETPAGIQWRDEANVNHTATLALLLSIAGARAVQKNAIWQRSWALKDQLDALNSFTATQADIDAIVVTFP